MLAATVRLAGDLDLAEECVQEAFVAALTAWAQRGIPANPAPGSPPRPAGVPWMRCVATSGCAANCRCWSGPTRV